MSTLEKTTDLLHAPPENQVEVIYSFVQFFSSQQEAENPAAYNDCNISMVITV